MLWRYTHTHSIINHHSTPWIIVFRFTPVSNSLYQLQISCMLILKEYMVSWDIIPKPHENYLALSVKLTLQSVTILHYFIPKRRIYYVKLTIHLHTCYEIQKAEEQSSIINISHAPSVFKINSKVAQSLQ